MTMANNKLGNIISKKSFAPSIRVLSSINIINSKAISQISGTEKKAI